MKKVIILLSVIVILAASFYAIKQPKNEPSSPVPVKTNHIVTFLNTENELYGMDFTGKIFTIIPKEETMKFCGAENCMIREWSVSNDGTKVVASFQRGAMANDYTFHIGYVDIYATDNKTVHFLADGDNPLWSPYSDEIAFADQSGHLSLLNFQTKEIKKLPLPYTFPVFSWISKDEIAFISLDNQPRFFAYFNVHSGILHKISFSQELQLDNASLSPLGDKLLVYSFINQGHDIGIANPDGSKYKRLSKSLPSHFGEGYTNAVWSPNEDYLAVNDQIVDSGSSTYHGLVRILDSKGNEVTQVDVHPINFANLCWLQTPQGQFLVSATDSNSAQVFNTSDIHHITLFKTLPGISNNFVCY